MNDANGYNHVQNTLAEDSDDEHENMRSPLLGGANGAARRGREPLPPVSNWEFMKAILLEVSGSSCLVLAVDAPQLSHLTCPRLHQHSDYHY